MNRLLSKGRLVYPSTALAAIAIAAPSGLLTQAAYGQDENSQEEVYVLSPFEVSSDKDSGYYASNAISATRVNALIEAVPLSIEVITSEFIDDTGSTDLRESLRYSAGIILESQNDGLFSGAFNDIGGVNNPEGVTNNKTQTSFKMRGFITDNVLRNGFRRQHATDSVNIDRVEVVRGPSALLYGIGNFGGIVNYVTKQPLETFRQELAFTYGSDNLYRVTGDSTGPISDYMDMAYRVTFAAEMADDWTDLKNSEHYFVSPIFTFRPFERTKVSVDVEYGERRDEGISFQSVRTPTVPDIPVTEPNRMEAYALMQFEGEDPRTFRWSGPDTYLETQALNVFGQVQHQFFEGLDGMIGYNYNKTDFRTRDVFGGLVVNTGPASLRDTIQARQIVDGETSDDYVELDGVIMQYNWNQSHEIEERDQIRAELNYEVDFFKDSVWLAQHHNLLAGYSYERAEQETANSSSESWNWKSPTDSSYIRFAYQTRGDQTVEASPLIDRSYNWSEATNEGTYFVWSGKFLKDKLFVIAGIRRDVNSVDTQGYDRSVDNPNMSITQGDAIGTNSSQFGVSLEVMDGVTLFALKSEGVNPNFDGNIDGYGRPLDAATAVAKEAGVKLNMFDGKIAATISAFKIDRSGVPNFQWWAPNPARGLFDRNADIVYRMDDFNPADPAKATNKYLQAARAEWDAAVASGAVFEATNPKQVVEDGAEPTVYTYLNASTPEGAAFLDAVFQALYDEFAKPRDAANRDADPWPGWLYSGLDGDDANTNSAAMDWASGRNGGPNAWGTISDSSEGWEAQVLLSPIDEIQMILNYSHVTRQIDNPGNFAEFDYAEGNWDRWATWYFPNQAWGLSGFPVEEVYPGGPAGYPNPDTSSWSGIGYGKGESLDDTPEHVISGWGTYRFRKGPLDGLQLGIGATWESKREYASGYTTAGQKKLNNTEAEKIQAWTDPRLTVNAMAKYTRMIGEKYDCYAQLNIDNLLDDTDQYGLLYAPGLSWKLEVGVVF